MGLLPACCHEEDLGGKVHPNHSPWPRPLALLTRVGLRLQCGLQLSGPWCPRAEPQAHCYSAFLMSAEPERAVCSPLRPSEFPLFLWVGSGWGVWPLHVVPFPVSQRLLRGICFTRLHIPSTVAGLKGSGRAGVCQGRKSGVCPGHSQEWWQAGRAWWLYRLPTSREGWDIWAGPADLTGLGVSSFL